MDYIMSKTLGIILAAGNSTRLYPATLASTKQTLPIYDKPLIYYPLSTLMLAGIREFVIITNPKEAPLFKELLWDSEEMLGITIHFATQEVPTGIPDAFNIVRQKLDGDMVPHYSEYNRLVLILGDNIFYGGALSALLCEAARGAKATVFATKTKDPKRFGIVTLDANGQPIDIEEKPEHPKSDLALTGIYFYDNTVFEKARKLKPSARNELEITDLNKMYLEESNLSVTQMLRGMIWFDTGTPDSLMEASTMVQLIQRHQGYMVGSPHEVAYNRGWITKESLRTMALLCQKSDYGKYLMELTKHDSNT
jgi:glucose-1-phosphate thymidylyltransferase